MRTTHTMDRLSGRHMGASGTTLVDNSQSFVSVGVAVATSILTNVDTQKSAAVTARTPTTIQAGSLYFTPGDFYEVTLPIPWLVQNTDGPIYDVECRRCGFSFPTEELQEGYCKDCFDEYSPRSGE